MIMEKENDIPKSVVVVLLVVTIVITMIKTLHDLILLPIYPQMAAAQLKILFSAKNKFAFAIISFVCSLLSF